MATGLITKDSVAALGGCRTVTLPIDELALGDYVFLRADLDTNPDATMLAPADATVDAIELWRYGGHSETEAGNLVPLFHSPETELEVECDPAATVRWVLHGETHDRWMDAEFGVTS